MLPTGEKSCTLKSGTWRTGEEIPTSVLLGGKRSCRISIGKREKEENALGQRYNKVVQEQFPNYSTYVL